MVIRAGDTLCIWCDGIFIKIHFRIISFLYNLIDFPLFNGYKDWSKGALKDSGCRNSVPFCSVPSVIQIPTEGTPNWRKHQNGDVRNSDLRREINRNPKKIQRNSGKTMIQQNDRKRQKKNPIYCIENLVLSSAHSVLMNYNQFPNFKQPYLSPNLMILHG